MDKGLVGLNPKDFTENPGLFEIMGLEENSKTSKKTGNKYKDWTLRLKGIEGDQRGQELQINFLFNRDFNSLIDSFGSDEAQWIGKSIGIKSKPDGEFLRWDLFDSAKVEQIQ